MITHRDCQAKYGEPELEKFMVLWAIPLELEVGVGRSRYAEWNPSR